jgi:hypothetical protein
MSLDQNMMPVQRAVDYTPGVGQWIALRVASGEPDTSLSALHRFDPERIPAPLIVRRWRQVWPAFDALMVEAEKARAAALMDQTIQIADGPGLAANAKNGIAARWRLAEALDRERFGPRQSLDVRVDVRVGVAPDLTDAQLAAIARGADPLELLAGDRARLINGPGTPPPSPPQHSEAGLKRGDEVVHQSGSFPIDDYPDSAAVIEREPGPCFLQKNSENYPEFVMVDEVISKSAALEKFPRDMLVAGTGFHDDSISDYFRENLADILVSDRGIRSMTESALVRENSEGILENSREPAVAERAAGERAAVVAVADVPLTPVGMAALYGSDDIPPAVD